MNKLIFCYLILLHTNIEPSAGQVIKTKDGITLGKRSDFIDRCANRANEKLVNIKGLEMDVDKYCSCVCDKIFPTLYSWDLEKAFRENKMEDLFLNDKNFDLIYSCVQGKFEPEDNFKLEKLANPEIQKKVFIKDCSEEMMNHDDTKGAWTKEKVDQYCECAYNKLYSGAYTYKDIQNFEDENSPIFNEIAVPCISEVFKINKELNSSTEYKLSDIRGENYRTLIPLVDYFGNGYKVKITIAGVSKYYLFDTGASDLIIDRDTERELLINGMLKKENYLYKKEYTLANGKIVMGQMIKVDNIVIGDYTLRNTVVGVIDDGLLLCGKSFLDKFRKWEFDKQKKELILYR